MQFHLEKNKTTSTPYIFADEVKGYMKLEGRCFPESVSLFFRDISVWLESHLASDFKLFTFDCVIEYFNSSTAKWLFNLLTLMDRRASEGKKIVVNWITVEGNGMMIECGEDFQEEMKSLEFNLFVRK